MTVSVREGEVSQIISSLRTTWGASAGLQVGHEQFLNVTTAFLRIYLETAKEQEAAFQPSVSAHRSWKALRQV